MSAARSALLLVAVAFLATATVGVQIGADQSPRVCEPIRIELCRGIGYNETSMPNLVGHELQADADFTLKTFSPLIQYGCSAQLHFFLCSAYVPMCTSKVPEPIGPCRGLCETVRDRCNPVLQGFGFPWPTALDCNRFPKENNHEHMCMEGPGEPGGNTIVGQGIIPGGNGAHFSPPISKITSTYQTSCQGLTKSHHYVRLNRSGRCAPLCESDILFDQHEKYVAEIWVTAWSYAALGTAVIATLCLIFSEAKWDKLLMPLVTCHSLVAVGWTIRFVAGRNATACGYDPQLPGVSLLLIDGLSNAPCAATFLLRYYFGMSAGVWWSILCLEWHRGIRRARSDINEPAVVSTSNNNNNNNNNKLSKNKKNETFSTLSQLAAWGLPALQTVAVLVARNVDADELLGACYVGNQNDKNLRLLVATPLSSYWIFGSVNLFAGYLVYRRNRTPPPILPGSLQAPVSIFNLNGVGTFLFIYCVPSALLLIAVFYEFANSDVWLNLPQPSFEPTPPVKAPMWPFMTRAFMELMLGVVSSAWVLGPRITTFYKNRFGPKYKQTPVKYPSTAYSTASYQTVCQPSSVLTMDKMSRMPRKYPPHTVRKPRGYKMSSQSLAYNGSETVL